MKSELGKVVVLIVVISFTYGCQFPISSLNSIYTPDTMVFEESLLGMWSSQEGGGGDWLFKEENGAYRIETNDDEDETVLKGHLVKLGENYFLDIIPHEDHGWPEHGKDIILTHMLVKIDWQDDLFRIWLFDEDIEWLKEIPKDNAIYVESGLLYTNDIEKIFTNSSTKDLQEFLTIYGSDERAFPQSGITEFKRKNMI